MIYQTLRNGDKIPALGFGTWNAQRGELRTAVHAALDAGFRHFDTAFCYGNEKDLGVVLQEYFEKGKVKREDLFITTKLWNTFHHPDLVRGHLTKSLEDLGLKYVDLYLIHWPMGYEAGPEIFPQEANGRMRYSNVDYIDTWKVMEQLANEGLCRSIGVSNFNPAQLKRLYDNATIKPAVNQVECHPYLQQDKLIKVAHELGVHVTCYAPLGSPGRPMKVEGEPRILDDPVLADIGKRHGKSVAQVAIRFQLQRGLIVIPKSVHKERIVHNFDVFDFKLTESDMQQIAKCDCHYRYLTLAEVGDHTYYPFSDEIGGKSQAGKAMLSDE